MTDWAPLLAQEQLSRTYYEVMRLRQLDEWWHWLLLALVCIAVIAIVTMMYVYDSRQLARGKRWLLLVLRVSAFVGLLVFVMDLQKRTEQKLVKNSRFAILVDTSQSMGIADQDAPTGDAKESRIAAVARAFAASEMLADLRKDHDVTLYRFDETNLPKEVASFDQTGEDLSVDGIESQPSFASALSEASGFWRFAAAALGVAAVFFLMHLILGSLVRSAEGESWALLVCVFSLIVATVVAAVANLRHPEIGPRLALGLTDQVTETRSDNEPTLPEGEADEQVARQPQPAELDWDNLLEPAGGSTRLGDAVNWVIVHERGNPLAGIAVLTDGNSNRGVEPLVVSRLASEAEIPLYPVGIGSELPPTNVRLVDLEAPTRVYPGDEFKLTGYIQAYGLAGKFVDVQMVSRPEGDENGEETLEADLSIELGGDGEVLPIPLQVTPDEVGKRIYTLRVTSENIDRDKSDNQIVAKVQIVDRKSRVLLLAGGPTREYRFVRNMLHRDKDVSVDVLLQTAVDGVSQEADEILFDLPFEAAELFEYDAIIAFDPDWTQFDQTQLELIEQWVAEKAGGMICVAGAVHTASWAEDRRAPAQIEIVRQLYPVTFSSSRIQLGRYSADVAWPLTVTEDGRSVPFLDLDEGLDGVDVWAEFPGIYGYYPVRDVKPAASVFARYSDPQSATNEQLPPLVVGQFYGSGRVVFLGSGEFWRLRAVDDGYFERFYTKLIRFVSEGRLLRDSNRGLLLVDKDRALRGDSIAVRASVVDQQFQPLRDPTINVTVRQPNGKSTRLELQQADGGREGMYAGRILASQAGDYQFQLTLPGDGEPIVLEREVRVRLPNLEIERPQRNDGLLQGVAVSSKGRYFVGLPEATAGDNTLAASVVSKRRETYLPGTPDREFQRRLMTWLLVFICGTLFIEWTIRRLSKLA